VAIGPRLAIEAQSLAQKLPAVSRDIQSGAIVGDVLRPQGWEWRQIVEIERFVRAHMADIVAWAQHTGAELLRSLADAWMIVLIPVVAFFILKDVEQLTADAISRLRHRIDRGTWWQIAVDVHRLLGDYVRAQLLLSLLTFVAWSVIFLAAGVP
jgi:predicted PurR-regulated permease PerM